MSAFLLIGRNRHHEFELKDDQKASKLIPLNISEKYNIRNIFTGNGYNIYADNNSNYWSSGDNKNGQCAVGKSQKTINSLTKIDYFETNHIKIKNVFVNVSGCCTFWISNKNILYGNGWNKHMQLGISTDNKCICHTPTLISNAPTDIIDIKSAFNYTLFLLQNGQVFSTLFSKYGGHGRRQKQSGKEGFKRININRKISKIAVGYYHSLFLDINGNVWCCGKNNCGQLGLGHNKHVKKLTPIRYFIDNEIKIKSIHCGGNYNIALDVNGKVYSWGSNISGECGVGTTENINIPQLISSVNDCAIKYVKCGRNHCYIGGDNKHYLFGNNYWNQCIVSEEKLLKTPMLIEQPIHNIYLGCDNTVLFANDERTEMACDSDDDDEKKEEISFVWEYKICDNEWKPYDHSIQITIEELQVNNYCEFTVNDEQQKIYKVTETAAIHFNVSTNKNIETRRKMKHEACETHINCVYYNICYKILKQQFPTIPMETFDKKGNRCYCKDCHNERGDEEIYWRGNPKKKYGLPIGFARFGTKLNDGFCKIHKVFDEWHACYHGTKIENVPKIFHGKLQLLKPGDVAIGGMKLDIRDGHIENVRKRYNKYSKKEEMFDPNQIYLSPSIKYSSNNIYAKWSTIEHPLEKDKYIKVQFVFQCRIRPDSYQIGQETIGAARKGLKIDEHFENEEVEWYTKENVGIILHGLLVRFKETN